MNFSLYQAFISTLVMVLHLWYNLPLYGLLLYYVFSFRVLSLSTMSKMLIFHRTYFFPFLFFCFLWGNTFFFIYILFVDFQLYLNISLKQNMLRASKAHWTWAHTSQAVLLLLPSVSSRMGRWCAFLQLPLFSNVFIYPLIQGINQGQHTMPHTAIKIHCNANSPVASAQHWQVLTRRAVRKQPHMNTHTFTNLRIV